MKMPTIFVGHGSPMIALEDNDITKKFGSIGRSIIDRYGRPKGILMISAHWYTSGTFVESAAEPQQIYDMYGFPQDLYKVRYRVQGSSELTNRVKELLSDEVSTNDEWGIDHGAWTVLVHMFPAADVPVVQLSVDRNLTEAEAFEMGRKLSVLREEGYLIVGSGNIVHNLTLVDWSNAGSSQLADDFDYVVKSIVLSGDYSTLINGIERRSDYNYAVPTKDHFYTLLYILGASEGSTAQVFNNVRNIGSISMTSYLFE